MEQITHKKSLKLTNSTQFKLLIEEMEKLPDLARGAPVFGSNRNSWDMEWEKISGKLNSHGRPMRSSAEWKKIWSDIKARTKKKMSQNLAELRGTGGGPNNQSILTSLEQSVANILCLQLSASPSGPSYGVGGKAIRRQEATLAAPSTKRPALNSKVVQPQLVEELFEEIIEEISPENAYVAESENHCESSGYPLQREGNRRNNSRRSFQEEQLGLLRAQVENQRKCSEALERLAAAEERKAAIAEKSAAAMERHAIALERAIERLVAVTEGQLATATKDQVAAEALLELREK